MAERGRDAAGAVTRGWLAAAVRRAWAWHALQCCICAAGCIAAGAAGAGTRQSMSCRHRSPVRNATPCRNAPTPTAGGGCRPRRDLIHVQGAHRVGGARRQTQAARAGAAAARAARRAGGAGGAAGGGRIQVCMRARGGSGSGGGSSGGGAQTSISYQRCLAAFAERGTECARAF